MKRIPFREEGNPLFPLPPDYEDLTSAGKREARVAACSQWTLWPTDPGTRGRAFAECAHFFDHYYLRPDEDEVEGASFDPMFYDDPMPSPAFHWTLADSMMRHKRCVAVAPRGHGKTYGIYRDAALALISHPMYSITYATSTNGLTEIAGERIKYQCYYNERVQDDFGRMEPTKGEGKKGMTHFTLNNRSSIFLTSAQSKQRGLRPRLYILDDPEYDPTQSTSMEVLRDGMKTLLFRIALPMVQRPGTRLFWVGTYVSVRHYLWHAMQTIQDAEGRDLAIDSRFNKWFRLVIPAAQLDGETIRSAWPEMHPSNEKERIQLGLTEETQTLEDIRDDIGDDAFAAEYLCEPGHSKASTLPEPDEKRHGYWFEDVDADVEERPWASNTKICYYSGLELKKVRLKDFLAESLPCITIDTSYTDNVDSDYKAALFGTLTPDNDFFALDLWAKRGKQSELVAASLRMAAKWKCPIIGVEYIREGIAVYNELADFVKTQAGELLGLDPRDLPELFQIKPGSIEKGARIQGALSWRFQHDKIKLPVHLMRDPKYPWYMLREQIIGFNPYAQDCGLQHDDCIDVLHMHRYIYEGRPVRAQKAEIEKRSAKERILAGECRDDIGLSLATQVIGQFDLNDLHQLLKNRNSVMPKDKRGTVV